MAHPAPSPVPADGLAWGVEHRSGAAADLHAASSALAGQPGGRRILVLEATDLAVVLGSTEPDDHVDGASAVRAGCQTARRRSGGSAVLVGPGRALWVDVLVPREDPLWCADVGQAGWWLGDAWVAALARCGLLAGTYRGPMRRTRWSDRVCFAGLGPGEVTAGAAKVVGISQRRTRHAALFQCAVPGGAREGWHPWDPTELLDVLAWGPGERDAAAADLVGAALGTADLTRVGEALVAELTGGSDDGAPRGPQVP